MATILRMPEIAANTTHARLETWTANEGDPVSKGDVLAEIETEKAMVEFTAETDGFLYRRLVEAGVDVAVGSPLAVMRTADEDSVDLIVLLGDDHPAAGDMTPDETPPTAVESTLRASVGPTTVPEEPIVERLFASPIARKMSRELGIDIADISGTGPDGRVTLRDVVKVSNDPQPGQAAPSNHSAAANASVSHFTDTPHSPMRRAIARRLTESKSSTPHFYLSAQCRVDALLELKRQANEVSDRRLTVTDFVVAAAAHAFVEVPSANVIWMDDALRNFSHVDISIAISTDSGLLVPVLRDVAARSLTEISADISDLTERARSGKIRQSELEGGSFTITNLGMFGTRSFSAILNPPQSGILAIGTARKAPIVVDDSVVSGTVMDCTLSVDHRAIDGALAAIWLAAFTRTIENPLVALL